MMILKAKVVGHQTLINDKIVYMVEVQDQVTQKTKLSKLRYSQFKDIHQQLQKLISKLKLHIILPQFPGRKLFGSTSKSQQGVLQRKKDLTNYLNDLLVIEKLHCLDIVKKYFIPDEIQSLPNKTKQINMQICIDRYTLVEDVVIYYVRLRDLNSHQEWTFKSRYSQLRDVHQALEQSKVKNLPNFPKKKIFGITNQSPQEIQKRRQQLQKEILNSDAIKYFIDESKKQAQRDKQLEAMRKKKKQKVQTS